MLIVINIFAWKMCINLINNDQQQKANKMETRSTIYIQKENVNQSKLLRRKKIKKIISKRKVKLLKR